MLFGSGNFVSQDKRQEDACITNRAYRYKEHKYDEEEESRDVGARHPRAKCQ